ncbi:CRISPR-associated helicase Cas3' [Bacteroides sp. 214]|uniref:CRISPR-associated helicase Cas3' n=1 Tax=Bacteroides sp. 214 TaxID=2302935 RepID=UPI0013D69620|nr:CRISPR-associated helicase Cas3' [Bacteroides sp. 214]NDW13600.1 CRISPR-associated helicase Cas3' [Bacteroides sp. 214]
MNNTNKFQVLAKSEPEISLTQHICDCLCIYEQLRRCIPNLPLVDRDFFWNSLKNCIILHDTGKAHREFQRMLKNLHNKWNGQRHEIFSVILASCINLTEKEKIYILPVILCHHKSFDELYSRIEYDYKNEDDFLLDILTDCKTNFREELNQIDKRIISEILGEYEIKFQDEDSNLNIHTFINQLKSKVIFKSSNISVEYLLLIGALKQCDHLASAGITKLKQLNEGDFSFTHKFPPHFHQKRASETAGNIILKSPTGSGKTEAAFLWVENEIKNRGQGRVFYVLPFTASINAMYERLNREVYDNKVGMLHGKVTQYLDAKMSEDSSIEGVTLNEDFKTLVTPVKIVTPFQLLKHLFGLKGYEKGLFEWAGAYFIFDEIHAYEPNVFAQIVALLKFAIQKLHVHVLVMTATLPQYLHKELEAALGNHEFIQADTALYNEFMRHQVFMLPGLLSDSLKCIQRVLDIGKEKVLIVCNTVEQAQIVYNELDCTNKVLLHGRFNNRDRVKKERELKGDSVKLLVGTQAIEVSLDIDYDIIYTEPAPLDALIQRFGRVNRRRKKGISPCYVFVERSENDKYIYKEEIVQNTIEILNRCIQEEDGFVKEAKLQEMMDFVYPDWLKGDREEYNQTLDLLEYFTQKSLVPFSEYPEQEEEFYKRFDGIKVLPVELIDEYQNLLIENQYVRAEGLLVSIRKGRFASLRSTNEIYKQRFCFESNKSKDLYDKSVWIIKRVYSEELGLQMNMFKETDSDNQL